MPDARHPDIGALLPALVRDAGLDIVDAWAEAPAGVGPGPVADYLERPHRGLPRGRPRRPASAGHRGGPGGDRRVRGPVDLADRDRSPDPIWPAPLTRVGWPTVGRDRGRRAGWPAGRASTPNRCWPTTWPTPPPASATARAALAYGAQGGPRPHRLRLRGRRRSPTWPPGPSVGRRPWDATSNWLEPAGRSSRPTGIPNFLAGLCGVEGAPPPRRRLRPGARDLPPVRRGADPARGPSTSTAPTPTSPRRSSAGWPRWAASGCRSPRSTGASPPAARATTWAWWWPPKSCRGARSGPGGSLITRPEILSRALVHGGTEEQKQRWLPELATGEVMNAVAVTEPDFGSDVAGIVTAATPDRGRLADQRHQDLVHLRRPGRCAHAAGPDRPRPDQGPPGSLALPGGEAPGRRTRVPLHPGPGGRRPAGRPGRMEGRPIDTLGYRGMHSYEIAFENWFVPADHLSGRGRLGRGFYLQMAGLRERPAADGGPGPRGHAGRL